MVVKIRREDVGWRKMLNQEEACKQWLKTQLEKGVLNGTHQVEDDAKGGDRLMEVWWSITSSGCTMATGPHGNRRAT